MIVKKKKAQTALEILVIFGILIVGAIIFALFYSTNIEKKLDTSSNIQGTYSDIENNLQSNDPQQPIETCGNDFCGPGENCIGCPDDCDCTNCPLTAPTLQITPVPITGVPAGAPGHNTFNLQIAVIRQSEFSGKNIKIKKITFNGGQTTVFYSGQNQIPTTGLEINQEMTEDDFGNFSYTISNLSSIKSGNYVVAVSAEVSGCDLNSEAKTMITIKGLSANLSLSPDGASYPNTLFGVNVNVNNYNSDSNISITKIYTLSSKGYLVNNVCSYDGTDINISGLSVNIMLDKSYDDYNYLFKNNLSCKYPGPYKLMFTLHDNDENTDYDYNATIDKAIAERCSFTLNEGTGTELDPYVISNPDDLDCIRYKSSSNFILGNNIDLNHTILSSDPKYSWYDETKGWRPIGTLDAAFTGSLDGADYEIQNLYSRRNSPNPGGGVVTPFLTTGDIYNSLFLYLDGADISNLKLVRVDLLGFAANPLVYYSNNSTFTDIAVDGNVIGEAGGQHYISGIVGYAKDSEFNKISFYGRIKGNYMIGGLIAQTNNVRIDQSLAVADINGMTAVGGLIGGDYAIYGDSAEYPSVINNSQSSVTLRSPYMANGQVWMGSSFGGLVGGGNIIILNSSSDVNMFNAYSLSGGLCGSCNSITNSYAIGNISTLDNNPFNSHGYNYPSQIGGLAGALRGATATNSYFIGNIELLPTPTDIGVANQIGGLIGVAYGRENDEVKIENCYSRANIIVSGNAEKVGGLVGYAISYPDINNSYANSYSASNITVEGEASGVGGFIGGINNSVDPETRTNIFNSYSIGNINISGTKTSVGGLIGYKSPDSHVDYSYWNTQTSGYSSSAGGLGRTTDQMTYPDYPSTYTDWDFSSVWAEDMEGTNDGYPYLLPSPPSVDLRGDPAPKVVEEGGEVFSYILISEDGNILDSGIINN